MLASIFVAIMSNLLSTNVVVSRHIPTFQSIHINIEMGSTKLWSGPGYKHHRQIQDYRLGTGLWMRLYSHTITYL